MAGKVADIGIVRVSRDISEQSHLGFLFTDREFGSEFNRVASVDSRLTLNDNWNTDIQFVDTETRGENGEKLNGRQTNLSLGRSGRHVRVHAHVLDTSEGYRTDLGFLHRDDRPDTKGAHTTVGYTFWPQAAALNSWGPALTVDHIEDQSGLRLFSQLMPEATWTWDGDTALTVYYEDLRERLRPQDFTGLISNRDFSRETWSVAFQSQVFSEFGFSGEITAGTAINLVPPAGMEPVLADTKTVEMNLLWRPVARLRVDTTYLYTELDDRGGAGKIFSNEILRSRWNYQFTKELSLRLIAQLEETDPSVLTSLEHEKNLNFDVLVRYVINPWSALYVGYNSNSSNFELIDTERGRTELIRTDDFSRDGEQLFVKFSYMLQP